MRIEVLGTEYTIRESNRAEEPHLLDAQAFCDTYKKEIVVNDMKVDAEFPDCVKDIDSFRKECIRHELIHAILYESGLDQNSWGGNEEIVDWIAIQFPKMARIFLEAECAD